MVALMTAQVYGHELLGLQPSFASGDDHHELVDDFDGHANAVVNTTLAEGIVNNIFFGP